MNTTSESLLVRLQQHAESDNAHIDQRAWETFVGLYTPLRFFWARKVGLNQAQSTWDIDYARMLLQQTMRRMQCDFEPATWQSLKDGMSQKLSVDQAAKQQDVSPWTIYSARSRLMRRLREQLDGML